MAKKDWVEIEKGTYTLKKKVPSHPIVTIPSHEDESTQSQAQRTK